MLMFPRSLNCPGEHPMLTVAAVVCIYNISVTCLLDNRKTSSVLFIMVNVSQLVLTVLESVLR